MNVRHNVQRVEALSGLQERPSVGGFWGTAEDLSQWEQEGISEGQTIVRWVLGSATSQPG